jgi:tRNA-dihydrouridine synthase
MGFTREEVGRLVAAFAERDEVAALELNVSCPNVKTGMVMGADPAETAALLDVVRPLTGKPLIVKLTPNCASPADVAAAAEQHGADAVSLVNTLRGMAFDPRRPGRPWLGGQTGGVSGPAIRAIALAQVADVRARVSIPIVGMGGVERSIHAHDLRLAGADLVAVGTESFRDPLAGAAIAAGLETLEAASAAPVREATPGGAASAEPVRDATPGGAGDGAAAGTDAASESAITAHPVGGRGARAELARKHRDPVDGAAEGRALGPKSAKKSPAKNPITVESPR